MAGAGARPEPEGPGGPAPAGRRAGAVERSLLRCPLGVDAVLIDLRALVSVEASLAAAPGDDVDVCDLRAHFGLPSAGPGRPVRVRQAHGAPLELRVDPEPELVRVPLARLLPFPPILQRAPALACLRGIVEEAGGRAAFLLDPTFLAADG